MKNKIVSLFAALGLITNVATYGNSASIGYVSDFVYRGEQKAVESFQSKLDLATKVAGLDASAHACTNQSVDTGVDSYGFAAGLGSSVLDGLLSLYGGFNHYEDVSGEALSEVVITANSNTLLSPSVSIYRNVNRSLYTYEGSLSHSLDLSFAGLNLDGAVGNTEVTSSDERTYYTVGAELTRNIGDAEAGFSIDLVDSDEIEREFVFGVSLGFNF